MKKICLLIIGVLFILISCSPSDKETDNGDIENEYILTHSDAYYNDVVELAKRYVSGRMFKVVIEDEVLYNRKDEVYTVYLSEVYSESSDSYEEAVEIHRKNYTGNSDYEVKIQHSNNDEWEIINFVIIE